MLKLLAKWLLSAAALLLVAYLYSGVQITSFTAALIAALVIGLLNAVLRRFHTAHPDISLHVDEGGSQDLVAGLLCAFPDLHFTIEDQLVQGDRVAFRWRATGTHTGPLGAAPPTGK